MSTYDTNSIYEWFGGNSKATALMSAEIANYFNKEIDLDGNRVSQYLQQYSCDLFENNLNNFDQL